MKKNSISRRIVSLNVLLTAGVILIFLVIVFIQKNRAVEGVDAGLNQLIDNNIATISMDIYNQVEALHGILLTEVENSLKVAWSVMNRIGDVKLDDSETVEWDAINQFTKEPVKVNIPKMTVGGQWLGKNSSMETPSLVVDEVMGMVGGTATIFQKMNEEGDMLRVCTNVKKLDGTRAIGTYIPAVNPDGTPNGVVQTVLSGKTFRGKAFVVNAWYLTAYEPIYNKNRDVIGVLYFGIRQEKSDSLRKGIMKTKVGKTGYVYVLNAKGKTKGHYMISKDGKRDGENIWEAKDSDGRLFIQSIVNKALKLEPGRVDYERYPWKNEGEEKARMKKVAITYFEPWDWVIAAGSYEDDFKDAKTELVTAVNGIVYWVLGAALILLAIVFVVSLYLTGKVTRPLNQLVERIRDIAEGEGDLTKEVAVATKDEIYEVADWFNRFLQNLREIIVKIKNASTEIHKATDEVASGSADLAGRTNEQAVSLTETSTTMEQFTNLVKKNTDQSEEADMMLDTLNSEIKSKAELVDNVIDSMKEIFDSSKKIDSIVAVINDISFQTNLLALNAAVEAARAGDAGRGFAVVASEVRNLAQKTAESSKSIQDIVSGNVAATQKGMELVKQTGEFFNEIAGIMDELVKKITAISESSREQNTGIEQINHAVVQLDEVSRRNNTLANDLSDSGSHMKSNTVELQSLVQRFKVE